MRLDELKPGARMFFDGAVETIKRIEQVDVDAFEIWFEDGTREGWNCGVFTDGNWAVPDAAYDARQAEHEALKAEHERWRKPRRVRG